MGVHNKSVRRPHALRPQRRLVGLRDPWLEIHPQFQPALLRLSAMISQSFTPGACALLIVLRHLRCGFAHLKLQVRPVHLLLSLTD
jgi:hypothetical protein